MGQRLNIQIENDKEVLANAYYHWSGYTSSALKLTSFILHHLENVKHDNDTVRAVRLLELTGAKLQGCELKKLDETMKNNEFEQATSRNYGLIAISQEGIEETQHWEEARVEIHLDTETVKLDLYYDYEDEEDEDEEDIEFYQSNLNYEEVSFKEFEALKEEILQSIEDKKYYVIANGKKLVFIV